MNAQKRVKWKSAILALLVIYGAMLESCTGEIDIDESHSDISTIRYGTSFGFYVGYCHTELIINHSKIPYTKSAKGHDLEDVSCERVLEPGAWRLLKSKMDLSSFLKLPEVIGCPDCADGGAEWIEWMEGDDHHRITFEYNKAPQALAAFVDELRMRVGSFENCGD